MIDRLFFYYLMFVIIVLRVRSVCRVRAGELVRVPVLACSRLRVMAGARGVCVWSWLGWLGDGGGPAGSGWPNTGGMRRSS